ncbi:hypothetical protein ACJVC5_07465 [Peredibacter sp. HCB2-198]|uniref:hypothetical protein n=1 Tax=Peredibacter sp. HCB2-198 TaxID=3383025 RepID=UPI0038B55BEF
MKMTSLILIAFFSVACSTTKSSQPKNEYVEVRGILAERDFGTSDNGGKNT